MKRRLVQRGLRHVQAILVVVLWFAGGGIGRAAEVDISIAGVAADTRSLSLVVEGPTFDWPISIRRNDGGETTEARIDVTPLREQSARPAEQQRLTVNGQPGDRAVVQLSGVDQVELRLTGRLPVEGDFKGQLGIVINNKRREYSLTITSRKNAPKIAFVGVGTDGQLAMTSDRAAFEWPVIVRRDDELADDAEVKLHVSALAGPSGSLMTPELRLDGKPLVDVVKLPRRGRQTLKLTGTADVDGRYTGELTYEIGGVRTPIQMVLTRTRAEFDLKVETISRIRSTTGAAGVGLQVRLLNTSSIERDIYLPTIARLDRIDTSGGDPVEIGTSDYKVTYALSDGTVPPSPLSVAAGRALDLRVTLEGLTGAGSYKGTMRFTAKDRTPKDVPFEMALRLHWLWAAAVIGLGVVCAAVVRHFQESARPRLLLQRDALGLRSKLEALLQAESADLVPRERQAIALLITQIDDASDGLATPDVAIATPDAAIGLVRGKLPLLSPWIMFRRRRDAIRPSSIGTVIEPDLGSVFETLSDPQAAEATISEAQGRLRGLEAKLAKASQDYIIQSINQIRTAISQFVGEEQGEFRVTTELLARAETEANALRLEMARTCFDQARTDFATRGARLLRPKLDAASPASGFDAADWSRFCSDVGRLLDSVIDEPDPEQRVLRWNEASRRYLGEMARRAAGRHARPQIGGLESAPARDVLPPSAAAGLPPSIIDATIGSLLPMSLGHGISLQDVNRSLWRYSLVFSVIVLVLAILSGLKLLYASDATFGWGDLAVAFLWGAGLHALSGQVFQGLPGLAQQLR